MTHCSAFTGTREPDTHPEDHGDDRDHGQQCHGGRSARHPPRSSQTGGQLEDRPPRHLERSVPPTILVTSPLSPAHTGPTSLKTTAAPTHPGQGAS